MVQLPYMLRGRWKLLGTEVDANLSALVAEVNGNLGAQHFARRAGIRLSQRLNQANILAVTCEIPVFTAPNLTGLMFVCPSPRRFKTKFSVDKTADAWVNVYTQFIYRAGPNITGQLSYGPTLGSTLTLPGNAPGMMWFAAGDNANQDTGDVSAKLQLSGGALTGYGATLIAWFKGRHQR